jgi:hypothetical protein
MNARAFSHTVPQREVCAFKLPLINETKSVSSACDQSPGAPSADQKDYHAALSVISFTDLRSVDRAGAARDWQPNKTMNRSKLREQRIPWQFSNT